MNESGFYDGDWLGLEWGDWLSLNPSDGELSAIPPDEGLYRVRHSKRDGLEYIGQTGRSLRGRIRSLSGCYKEEMPYTDPHVAAPCLWAVRREYGPQLEVSYAAPPEATEKQPRLAIEEALIAVYRRETGQSTAANFGRIIPGYKRSSMRSDGVTGGPLQEGETEPNAATGVDPLPWTNAESPTAPDWMGVDWSDSEPLANAYQQIPEESGLYRIWREDEPLPLEYIGQSQNLKNRLYRHRRNRDGDLLFSFAALPELDAKHKLEEVETDLIGAHWLATSQSPQDQF